MVGLLLSHHYTVITVLSFCIIIPFSLIPDQRLQLALQEC